MRLIVYAGILTSRPPRSRLKKRARRIKLLLYKMLPPSMYMRLYARDTDRRVRIDPGSASGHPGERVAPKVMAYVRAAGLEPHHRLLDFGCGTLRTGHHLVRYLNPGCYVGVDISEQAVAYAQQLVRGQEDLAARSPLIRRIAPYESLMLPWRPDFILCHSVFTHLPREAARATFKQLWDVMGPDTTLAFTAFIGDEYGHFGYKDIRYPVDELVRVASDAGIEVSRLDGDWNMRQTVFIGRRRRDDSSPQDAF